MDERERWHETDETDHAIESLFLTSCKELGSDHFLEHLLAANKNGKPCVDHVETLAESLRSLTNLCGSPEAAAQWLFGARGFAAIVGNDPYYNLNAGNFWTLAESSDWLKILDAYKDCPSRLYSEIFGYAPRGATS